MTNAALVLGGVFLTCGVVLCTGGKDGDGIVSVQGCLHSEYGSFNPFLDDFCFYLDKSVGFGNILAVYAIRLLERHVCHDVYVNCHSLICLFPTTDRLSSATASTSSTRFWPSDLSDLSLKFTNSVGKGQFVKNDITLY